MGRKTTADTTEPLTQLVGLRLSQTDYDKYNGICEKSNCGSVAEVVRRILTGKSITLYQKDATMDGPMEQLTAIRQELKAIGQNINQVTRNFHVSTFDSQRHYQLHNALAEYKKLEAKVNLLMALISQLSKQWLQK